MAILGHGSDLRLAPTIAPLVKTSQATVRGALDELAHRGFTAAQLDAALPGIRPRDLDQRARRDLAATLTRSGITLAGLDLWIPRDHFTDPEHVDRAVAAAVAAIELAADLGRVPLSLSLPIKNLSADVRSALLEAADGRSIRLAVHAEDQLDDLLTWVKDANHPALGLGCDPAALLAMGLDPVATIQRLADHLAVARLADWKTHTSPADGQRIPVSQGDLDVIPYRASVDLASHRLGPVVLDLRGLPKPLADAETANHAWQNAAFTV
ncbi:MAG: TIM barrel protein [Phycisphaeraceae bacterium]|nr:TIM barrel protein [Phycisphaeraceae bacterium]